MSVWDHQSHNRGFLRKYFKDYQSFTRGFSRNFCHKSTRFFTMCFYLFNYCGFSGIFLSSIRSNNRGFESPVFMIFKILFEDHRCYNLGLLTIFFSDHWILREFTKDYQSYCCGFLSIISKDDLNLKGGFLGKFFQGISVLRAWILNIFFTRTIRAKHMNDFNVNF